MIARLAVLTGIGEDRVAEALDELELKGLLSGDPRSGRGPGAVSRRSALKRIGAAGLAATTVPLIVSATIGAPLAHASGGTVGLCASCSISDPTDTCAAGFVCDADHLVCIPMGCSFSPCTIPGTCGDAIFSGTCTTGCAAGNLCCGIG